MTVNVPIFTKLMPTQQLFVMNSHTHFQETPTNGSVTKLQTDGPTDGKT